MPVHEFAYDALGRLVRAAHSAEIIERRYDSLDRLIEETSRGQTVRLAYDDLAGDLVLTYPDGRQERTHHDTSGRPVHVTLETAGPAAGGVAGETLAAIGYQGSPATISHANGIDTTLTYDRPGRPVSIAHFLGPQLIDGARLRYDNRDRRAVVQLAGNPNRTTLHTFDARDRITRAQWGFALPTLPDIASPVDHTTAITKAQVAAAAATTTEAYTLDNADGREVRTQSLAGHAAIVDVNVLGSDHRIVAIAGHPITHHIDGPRASDESQHYDVDALGRIVRVRDVTSGAVSARFGYDALSRAATGELAGIPFERAFLGATWIHEKSGAANDVRQATPHPLWPQPLCISTATDVLFIHADGGHCTLCVTDAAGAVRERHRYGPFGRPEMFHEDGVTPLAADNAAIEPRWRGMLFLAAIDLYEAAQRLYDPELGVFLARDPLLYTDSPSPWVFAGHNPVDFADPSGLEKTGLAGDRSESIISPRIDPNCLPLTPPGRDDWLSRQKRWDDSRQPGLRLPLPPTDWVKMEYEGTTIFMSPDTAEWGETMRMRQNARTQFYGMGAMAAGLAPAMASRRWATPSTVRMPAISNAGGAGKAAGVRRRHPGRHYRGGTMARDRCCRSCTQTSRPPGRRRTSPSR